MTKSICFGSLVAVLMALFNSRPVLGRDNKPWWEDYHPPKATEQKEGRPVKSPPSIPGRYVSRRASGLKLTVYVEEDGTLEILNGTLEEGLYKEAKTTGTWTRDGDIVELRYGEGVDIRKFEGKKIYSAGKEIPALTPGDSTEEDSDIKGAVLWKDQPGW